MSGSLGAPELLVIVVVALVVSARAKPEFGKSLAGATKNFKKATRDAANTPSESAPALSQAVNSCACPTHVRPGER